MIKPITHKGLEWSGTLLDGKPVNFSDAEKAVAELGDGWRLPTREELQSIVDASRHDPAIDPDKFPDTESRSYWTSTTCAWNDNARWVVAFYTGHVYGAPPDYSACVRAVRDAGDVQGANEQAGWTAHQLPPAGIKCLFNTGTGFEEAFTIGVDSTGCMVVETGIDEPYQSSPMPEHFRPIASASEAALAAAMKAISFVYTKENYALVTSILEQLHHAGALNEQVLLGRSED